MYFENLFALEISRKALSSRLIFSVVVVFCCFLLGIFLKDSDFFVDYFRICIVFAVILVIFNGMCSFAFYKKFNTIIVQPILKKHSLALLSSGTKDLSHLGLYNFTEQTKKIKKDLDELGVFDFNKCSITRCIVGNNFFIYDIDISKTSTTDKNDTTTLFDGTCVYIDKKCDFNLYLLSYPHMDCKYKKLHLDNAIFNKTYTSYSDETVDAFGLLTPVFMEEFLSIGDGASICYNRHGIWIFYKKRFLQPHINKAFTQQQATKYDESFSNFLKLIKFIAS